MSLLSDLASSTSALIWGPPAPAAKDPPPQPPKRSSISTPISAPTTPISRKAILLKPNLGLGSPKMEAMAASKSNSKQEDLPLPPPPEEEASKTASSVLVSTGASAISLLGSAVMGIGSVAISAWSPAPADTAASTTKAEVASAKTPKAEPAVDVPPETFLSSISDAVLGRAASMRDAAIDSVTGAASSLASSAAHTVTNTATDIATSARNLATGTSPTPAEAKAKQLRRASTLPIQYTATGEPFSSDPSISAMQRIPDHPCGNPHKHRTPLAHCCSAADVLNTVEEGDCTCKCHALDAAVKDENGNEKDCTCVCHSKTAYSKVESGHFHRVEQLVKGTKRVVRDIKNVL